MGGQLGKNINNAHLGILMSLLFKFIFRNYERLNIS